MKENVVSLRPYIERMELEEENRQAYFAELAEQRQFEHGQQEAWGLERVPGEDNLPYADEYIHFDLDDPEQIMQSFDALVEQQRQEDIEFGETLNVLRGLMEKAISSEGAPDEPELEIRDPHPDEPLTLSEAVCLPELGGQLYAGDNPPDREGRVGKATLRAEITAGRLKRVPPFNKNWFVSRTTIKEWLELRHDGIDNKRAAASPAADSVQDIRKRQEATRSSLAAEKSQRSASAVEGARLRIQQARDRLK